MTTNLVKQPPGHLVRRQEVSHDDHQWTVIINGSGMALAYMAGQRIDPNFGIPAMMMYGMTAGSIWYGVTYLRAWIQQRKELEGREPLSLNNQAVTHPRQVLVPPPVVESSQLDTQNSRGRQPIAGVKTPVTVPQSEPPAIGHEEPPHPAAERGGSHPPAPRVQVPVRASTPAPNPTEPASAPAETLTYRGEAAAWWDYFPGLTRAMLQPFTVIGQQQQQPRALTPRETAEKLLFRLRKEPVQQAILGLSPEAADSAENPAILMLVLHAEPGTLMLNALREICAAVHVEPCETPGDYALFLVLAKPCDYTVEKGKHMVQQQRMIDKLPVAPLFTDLIRAWHGRIEMKIPVALQINSETGKVEIAWFDLTSQTHLGGFGRTGAGKDQMVSTWVFSLVLMNKPERVRVCALDPKGGADYAWVGRCPNTWRPTAATEETIMVRVEELYSFIKFRGELMSNALPGGGGTVEKFNTLPLARRQAAWDETLKTWPDDSPHKPGDFTGTLFHLVVVLTEANDPMFKAGGALDTQLQAIIKQGRAAGVHLIVSAQQVQGLSRIASQLDTVLCGSMKKEMDSRLVLNREDSAGDYSPHLFPVPVKHDPATLGLFALRRGGEETLARSFFLPDDDRDKLADWFAQRAANVQEPVRPAPVERPPFNDQALLEWYVRQSHSSRKPSLTAACEHFFGGKNRGWFDQVKEAWERLNLPGQKVFGGFDDDRGEE